MELFNVEILKLSDGLNNLESNIKRQQDELENCNRKKKHDRAKNIRIATFAFLNAKGA